MPRKKKKNFIAVDNDTLGEEILPLPPPSEARTACWIIRLAR